MVRIQTTKCKACGAIWAPRVEKPKKCPYCQSLHWAGEKSEKEIRRRQAISRAILEKAGFVIQKGGPELSGGAMR